jgi:hypothetical protein
LKNAGLGVKVLGDWAYWEEVGVGATATGDVSMRDDPRIKKGKALALKAGTAGEPAARCVRSSAWSDPIVWRLSLLRGDQADDAAGSAVRGLRGSGLRMMSPLPLARVRRDLN